MKKELNLKTKYKTNNGELTGEQILQEVCGPSWAGREVKNGDKVKLLPSRLFIDDEGYTLRQSISTGQWWWVKAKRDFGYQVNYNQNNKYAHNKWYRNYH